MVGPKCATCGNPIKSENDIAHKIGKNYTIVYCKKCGATFDLIVNTNAKED